MKPINMTGIRFPKDKNDPSLDIGKARESSPVFTMTDNFFSGGLSSYNTKESLFYHLKPSLCLLRVLGAYPAQFEASGLLPRFKMLSAITAYTVSFYVLLKLPTLAALKDYYFELVTSDADLSESIFLVILMSMFTYNIWLPLLTWSDVKRTCNYFKDWNEFQMAFISVTRSHLQLNIRKYLLPLVLAICTMSFLPIFVMGLDLWRSAVLMVSSLYFADLLLLKIFLFKALHKAGTTLINSFKGDLQRKSFAANMLEGYRLLWFRWSRLVSEEDCMFGTLYAFFMIAMLFITVITSYCSLMDLKTGRVDLFRLGNSAPTAVGGVLILYFMCRNGHSLSDLGKEVQKDLDRIGFSSLPKQDRRVVKAFLATIKMNPPVVSAVGFTNVDKTLFIALMSAVVTYLIVLLQFGGGE